MARVRALHVVADLQVAEMLWRPWYFFAYMLPMSVMGRMHLETVPWWQLREIIVGTVFWCGVIMVVYFANSQQARTPPENPRMFGLGGLAVASALRSGVDTLGGPWGKSRHQCRP